MHRGEGVEQAFPRPCPESVNSPDRQCMECPTFFHPFSSALSLSPSLPLPRRLFLSGFLFAAAAAIIGRSVVRPCFLHSQIIISEGGMRCERGSGEGRRRIGRREELVKLGKFGKERGGSCQCKWHLRIYLLN